MNPEQITEAHRSRLALVYIRQSTTRQVEENRESQRRQRALVARAEALGWRPERIFEVDEDLASSASRSSRRLAFERMVSETALGKVGLIISLEVSRVSRGNCDWYHLLDVCAVTRTLIADLDGIYEPGAYNDRLLLGLKGTMSEAELHVMKQRMVEAILEKAKRGEYRRRLSPGLVWDEAGRIHKHPDEQVTNVIELMYQRFDELGTVHQTQVSMAEDGILVPVLSGKKGRLVWKPPSYAYVHRALTNPLYAGAYTFGERQTEEFLDSTHRPVKKQKKKERKDWHAFITEHHEGYISWEDYEKLLERIAKNRQGDDTLGAAREGESLLQGLIVCGQCGRRMKVGYGKGSRPTRYRCSDRSKQLGTGICQAFGALRLERAIEELVVECLKPLGMEAMIQAAAEYAEGDVRERKHCQQQVERAAYEVELARRAYDAVDSTNRLVARELERRFEKALEALESIEDKMGKAIQSLEKPLSAKEQELLRSYSTNLPLLWSAPGTRAQDRTRLARCLIDKVVVEVPKGASMLKAEVHWSGGECTTIELPKGKIGAHRYVSDPELIELMGKLAKEFSDVQIARILNRKGLRTPKGLSFTAHRVACLRHNYAIPTGPKVARSGDDIKTALQAGEILGVAGSTVIRWVETGLLRGHQATEGAPWRIRVTKEDIEKLTTADVNEDWLPLKGAALILGVTQQRVLQKVKSGELQAKRVMVGRRSSWRINIPSTSYGNQPPLFDEFSR